MPTISKLSNHWKRAQIFLKRIYKFRFTFFIKFPLYATVQGVGGGGILVVVC